MKEIKEINLKNIFINPPPAHEFTSNYQVRKQYDIAPTKKQVHKDFNDKIHKSVVEHMNLYKGLENEQLKINYYNFEYSKLGLFFSAAPMIFGIAYLYYFKGNSGSNLRSLFVKNAFVLNLSCVASALIFSGVSEPKPVKNPNNIEETFSLLNTIMYDAGKTKYGY